MKKILLFFFLLFSIAGNAQNTWQFCDTLPGTKRCEAIAFTIGNESYFGTGYGSNLMVLNDMWKFNPNGNIWTQMHDFPVNLYGATAFVINDTAYISNGRKTVNGSYNIYVYKYNAALDTFEICSTYPGSYSYTTMSFVINNRAYIGIGYSPLTNEMWEFNPDSNTWAQKASFPGALRQNTAAVNINGKGYVGAGAHDPIEAYGDFWSYDPTTDSWDSLPPIPGGGRFGGIEFTLNDKLFVGCGYDYSYYLRDMWSFDPFTNSWTQESDFGGTARYGTIAFSIGNTAFAGSGRSGNYFRDLWKFTPNSPNLIRGYSYRDVNSNGISDSSDAPMKNLLIEIQPSGGIFSTSNSGIFQALADIGNHSITLLNPPAYYSFSPIPAINFTGSGVIDTSTVIAFTPTALNTDLEIHVTPLTPAQPGHQEVFNITILNNGTLDAQNFTVTTVMDTGLTYLNTIPADSVSLISNDSVSFFFANLSPGEEKSFMIYTDVGIYGQMNDTLKVSGYVEFQSTDIDSLNNYDEAAIAIVTSFDPNDISVAPATSLTTNQVVDGEWLTYTIRFQNTGNAFADEVRIGNPISNSLNLSTLEVLSSSHNYNLKLNGDRNLKFTFPNILLADSNANEPASHGFIKYRLKPNTTLVIGDSIVNAASIYFDYNPPVSTNQVITKIETVSGLTTYSPNTYLYPNPAKDILFIKGINSIQSAMLYDISGKLVLHLIAQSIDKINLGQLGNGFYLIKIKDSNNNETTYKLIISK